MLPRAASRLGTRAFSTAKVHPNTPKSRAGPWVIASSAVAGLTFYSFTQNTVYNDAPKESNLLPTQEQFHTGLSPLVWGSNQNHLIAPERDSKYCIKSPTPAPQLFSGPLRDLVFSTRHAACVDTAGNVYQWGDGFFGHSSGEGKRPHLTLRGKNIISLAVTRSKIFALSTSGKVYVLSASLGNQAVASRTQSWWNIFPSEPEPAHFTELNTDVAFLSGERFTTISAGSDHLLALTSHGRTFAHPVTRLANWHGQLGLRKISIRDPVDATKRVPLELTLKPSRETRDDATKPAPKFYGNNADLLDVNDEDAVGFFDRLFEVPSLRGLDIQQAVAGDRTSFVVTRRDGRVLGWGANEYGQLGLGANTTLPSIAVPTEIVLSKFTDRGTTSRCIDVTAGGDLTYFTVERTIPMSETRVVDVLACGNGQWGGLGNGSYSNAQGTPLKVKNISGLLEYDEQTKSLKPLKPHHVSVAPGPATSDIGVLPSSSGHVIATLDTIPLSHYPKSASAADAADAPGRDVLVWGLNQNYQLGNGKRASVNTPTVVQRDSDDEGRLMCRMACLHSGVIGRKLAIEQRAVAGPGLSVVYWRVV